MFASVITKGPYIQLHVWSGIGFVIDPITKGDSNRQNRVHATMHMVHATGRKYKRERERVPHMKSVVTL